MPPLSWPVIVCKKYIRNEFHTRGLINVSNSKKPSIFYEINMNLHPSTQKKKNSGKHDEQHKSR